ncbi:baseplate wedge subunit [Synechococcus phage S-CAM22]|uniref:Baseplate wedge subunit n=1 Tax=Synechococcus phage S-CAM22 TaxID=1883365 RepID=A0A1D8KRB1_9CAUD|nr:baseplate wedge subunit [Synechococcus phage S-CAM22]YP_010088739.1 baseplate wedge subunit [Synechococcus phage S-CAM22]AOV60910.1 baseplate wedge subunit [Synechococcus phage S-CAM22]AOV61124.1 baseplate wedge subunit [Synechococcus phage S-CAM22]AOV61338.1 baseplate wedge subunit [Synechococcus phage S-CAM22]
MQPNNLTALDFEDIKSSIKSYLRTRTEFSDYDFDGSSLSYLIDLLAYNTYYTSFNANMAMNEAFLPSATVRDNVVNIAKLLNYTPRSITASKGCLHLKVQTDQLNGFYPSSVTLKKGSVASGGAYIWNILSDITVSVDQVTGIAEFDNLTIREGSLVTFSYVVNTFANQSYKVPSEDADISTLIVKVRPNESSTQFDLYSRAETVATVTPTTRSYFLSETEDMRYEIRFGDDSVGRAVKDGEVIDLEYLVTSGTEGNSVGSFSFIGKLTDNNGAVYNSSRVTLTVKQKSQQGDSAESIESIKYNAPRYYSAQYRAVTAQDYAIITRNIYDNALSVVAYGGDTLNPPIYGKVFIVIKTKTGSNLNDAAKNQIANNLRPYAMAAIDPVIVDPDDIYVNIKIFALYDTGAGSNASEIKSDIDNAVNDWATQTQINNFNSTFRASQLEKAIGLSNKSVTDTSLQISLLKYIKPDTNQTNTYCVATGSDLYNSGPSQDGSGGDCKKEPVVVSGTFRTADRPGVDQQFEDDGYGNLRTFYNTGTRKIYTDDEAGTVDYGNGQVCFGPVNIVGAGGGNLPAGAANVTDPTTGIGDILDPTLLSTGIQIPVVFIPANNSTIPATTPGTILNISVPSITVAPIGTVPPPTIPLNSLTPTDFAVTPATIEIPTISNAGSINDSSCF